MPTFGWSIKIKTQFILLIDLIQFPLRQKRMCAELENNQIANI